MLNLVVVAHPDDEILGFGAAGAKLVKQGEIVQPIILCGNVDVRHKKPTDEELYRDMCKANNILGFNEPVLGSFPNIRMNNVDHIEIAPGHMGELPHANGCSIAVTGHTQVQQITIGQRRTGNHGRHTSVYRVKTV